MPNIKVAILKRLRRKLNSGHPLVFANAGSAAVVSQLKENSLDLVVLDNSGSTNRLSSLLTCLMASGNANDTVTSLLPSVLKAAKGSPLAVGVCATDPFLTRKALLKNLTNSKVSGIQNFPSVGLFDGNFRKNLERTGIAFSVEVDFIQEASKAGLLTLPMVFTKEEAEQMIRAGADILVVNTGFADIRETDLTDSELAAGNIQLLKSVVSVVKSFNKKIPILICSINISKQEHAQWFMEQCPAELDGFFVPSYMNTLSRKFNRFNLINSLGKLRFSNRR